MYYKEKFEDNKWWYKLDPNDEWKEFNDLKYKEKAIQLSNKHA